MKSNPLADVFDDVSDLELIYDDGEIKKIKGEVRHNDVDYKVTISTKETTSKSRKGRYNKLYNGTVSIISPEDGRILRSEARRRKKQDAGKSFTDKDIYATAEYHCDSPKVEDIKAQLIKIISDLYEENRGQLSLYLRRTMTPDVITPSFAADHYVDDFLNSEHFDHSEEENAKRRKNVQKFYHILKSIPMCRITKRDILALRKHADISDANMKLLAAFWEWLILTRKCSGKNPFPEIEKKEPSIETLNRRATKASEIAPVVFDKFFTVVNKKISGANCGAALAASGFTLEERLRLTWGDVEFSTKLEDYSKVTLIKERNIVAKHDFSRPTIPDTAKYLRKCYSELLKNAEPEELAKCYVVSDYSTKMKKALEPKVLNDEINHLLVRAYSLAGTIPPKVLSAQTLVDNYTYQVNNAIGLSDDEDTAAFLSGKLLRDTTYINYESHTSDAASMRMYTLLKSISREEKMKQVTKIRETKTGTVYTATPRTNHETAQLTGRVRLNAGEKIVIRVEHGVTGRIDVLKRTFTTKTDT